MFLTRVRFRLMGLVLVAVVPSVVVLASTVRTERLLLEDSARTQVLAAARQAEEIQAITLSEARGVLRVFADSPLVQGADPERCSVAAARIVEANPRYANLGAVTADGTVYCSAVPFPGTLNLLDRSYIRDALDQGTFAVGRWQIGRITGKASVNVGYPVVGENGAARGAVFVALDLGAIGRDASRSTPVGATLTLLDREGVVLARTPDTGTSVPVGARDEDLAEHFEQDDVRAGGVLDHRENLIAFLPMGDGDAWVVVQMPKNALFAKADRNFQGGLFAVGVFAVLTALAAWWAGETMFVRRVKALSELAGRIAGGDLEARSAEEGSDEIGDLARSLDAMATSLGADRVRREGLQEQLRQAQKMEVVGRLAGGVAHDFGNLLTAILGYAELLRDSLGPSRSYRELDEVIKSAHRATAVTRQLLAFSRHDAGVARVFDVNAQLRGMERLIRRVIGDGVRLEFELADDVPTVRADPGQLEQAVLNLAVNARDAMTSRQGSVRFITRREEAEVVVSVVDDGQGMSPELLARVFEPFFTTKATGTGLGLPIVREITERFGGRVRVQSEPGKGSRFDLILPACGEPAESSWEASGVVRPGNETVLVVEDDAAVRAFARRALESEGYLVIDAVDAEDGEACAEAHLGPIHLLLTDLSLPGEPGRTLARRLVGARPELAVLYMTGFLTRPDESPNNERDVLQKPFGKQTLLRRVRKVLDGLLDQPSDITDRPPGLPTA